MTRCHSTLRWTSSCSTASDKGMRRLGTISSARGRPVDEIDLDYSPVQLEDTFADEDEKALAGL